MSKFRFYVIDSELGEAFGTNDEKMARSYSESFEHYVLDSERDLLLNEGADEEITKLEDALKESEEDED